MKQKEEAKAMLEDLVGRSNDIKSVIVATSDGITITGVNLSDAANRLSAMAAAALGLGKQLVNTAFSGELKEFMITGVKGQVFIYSISSASLLVVITKELPNVAMINWESQKTISQLVTLE